MRKAPKLYLTDSGITTSMLSLGPYADILGHPGFGALWEQTVLANIRGIYPDAQIFYYRTASGNEIDFVVHAGNSIFAIECKASASPSLSNGNHAAIDDIHPQHTFIITPTNERWPYAEGIDVLPLDDLDAIGN